MKTSPNMAGESQRQRILFNFDWRFRNGDRRMETATHADFDDSEWEAIDLPHDWSVFGPFDPDAPSGGAYGFRPQGVGWYRKQFATPRLPAGGRLIIEFEGVYMAPDVWLNGAHLGKRCNGYLDFGFDITDRLKPGGGENILAVRVDNSAPGEATVAIETEVTNAGAQPRLCLLATEIRDPSGNIAAAAEAAAPVAPGETYCFRQEIAMDHPQLWSCETPALYRAISHVGEKSGIRDQYETVFGIREIVFSPDRRLLLNGKKVVAKGVNIHHDNGCLGAAAFDRAIERRLEILKEMGCNAVRLSHNPHATALLDMCDRMGILVYDEAYDKWTSQFNGGMAPFSATWPDDVKDWIARDRNHPSVFIWSVGNEVADHQMNIDRAFGVLHLKELVDSAHRLDPSRKVTCGLFPAREQGIRFNDPRYDGAEPAEMAFHMDVMSVNYVSQFFERDHAKYPQLVFLMSEATTNGGAKVWFDYDKSYTVGQFYWGGIDYIGEAGKWPQKCWDRGLIDRCGLFKPHAHYVRATHEDSKPVVFIAIAEEKPANRVTWNDVELVTEAVASHWNWPEGATIKLAVYTNCESVEPLLNGNCLGVKRLADHPEMLIPWDPPYTPGVLAAVARKEGEIVAEHALTTVGPATRLALAPDRAVLKADGLDLSHTTVSVTDKNGIVVPDADHLIRFTVSGAGTNADVDNGDNRSDELWQADSRRAFEGRALLVVRAGRSPGRISITAAADGLEGAETVLSVM